MRARRGRAPARAGPRRAPRAPAARPAHSISRRRADAVAIMFDYNCKIVLTFECVIVDAVVV